MFVLEAKGTMEDDESPESSPSPLPALFFSFFFLSDSNFLSRLFSCRLGKTMQERDTPFGAREISTGVSNLFLSRRRRRPETSFVRRDEEGILDLTGFLTVFFAISDDLIPLVG